MRKYDQNKVPDDFPQLKSVGITRWKEDKFIEDGIPYQPYYRAKEVWKWFKEKKKVKK